MDVGLYIVATFPIENISKNGRRWGGATWAKVCVKERYLHFSPPTEQTVKSGPRTPRTGLSTQNPRCFCVESNMRDTRAKYTLERITLLHARESNMVWTDAAGPRGTHDWFYFQPRVQEICALSHKYKEIIMAGKMPFH